MSRGEGGDEGSPGPSERRLTEADQTQRMEEGGEAGEPAGEDVRPGRQFLSPGDLLAGRFRIVGFLGEGGMGEVYEAQDVELGERVALKTVRPEIAALPGALARFRREINLSRKVTHPNVCRIFDLRHHRPAVYAGPRREIVFLTMELLGGETLAERLERDGPMTPEEALPIVRQMADGLQAAHRVGVVHRDFKSGNVMLVPTPEGPRAAITDFGLARGPAGSEVAGVTITGTDTIIGSPAYMAPEQVAGDPVDAPADVYSLGVVLYEMVTGGLPFTGETAMSIAVKRLREPPPPPRLRAPELPEVWEETILACLAREPGARPASALEVARALAGRPVEAAAAPGLARRLRLAFGAAAALVAVLAGLLVWSLGRGAADRPPPPVGERRSLAVMSFRNLAQDPEIAWLSTALAELLASNLGGGRELRLIPRETVARAELELGLPRAQTLAADTLKRLESLLGSDLVVLGSFLAAGPRQNGEVRVDVSLQETASGEIRLSVADTGGREELAPLVSRLGRRLQAELGVAAADGLGLERHAAGEVARFYAQGLERLRLFDARGARELLERVVAVDPDSPLAHSALGDAWKALGYDARAEEEAKLAFELAGDLPWEQRRLLEGRYREAAGQWPEAIAAYGKLWEVYGDSVDYGLDLARSQTDAGEGAAALVTIAAVRELPAPRNADPRIDLAEAAAAKSLGDYQGQLAAARRAVAAGEELGARLLVAQGRLLEGEVSEQRGDFEAAAEAYRAATRLYAEAGDRVGEARALHNIAIVLARQGNAEGSRELLEEVLATYRAASSRRDEVLALSTLANVAILTGDLGAAGSLHEESAALAREINDKRGEARALTMLASILRRQGEAERAAERYREVLAVWRELGDRAQVALTLSNLANALRELGDDAEALRLSQEALSTFNDLGDRPSAAGTLSNIAAIRLSQGELDRAERLYRDALAIYREIGAGPGIAEEHRNLGRLAWRRGDTASARQSLAESLAAFEEQGAGVEAAVCRFSLARLALETGDPGRALPLARQAAEAFAAAGIRAYEALALATEGRALAASGQLPEARRRIARATELAAAAGPEVSLPVAVDAALVAAATGDRRGAIESLGRTAGRAAAAGIVETELEARLALGTLELAAGLPAGADRLAELEAQARDRGYEGVARRAARARAASG